ncbi:hypothetical protein BV25DRAFT_1818284 [Artomyces pyxidatus]|uniref:Uncharacterized protein n=1 Tax=Artomyces pyxidatus TaxID=48021 RepID=A0ACB8TLF8_9AGAM|nr:hypothetical protein BV25DRAFT_1818284 [Artomyces pyxidatus]
MENNTFNNDSQTPKETLGSFLRPSPPIARLPVEIIRELMIRSSRIPEFPEVNPLYRPRAGETAMFVSQVCARWRAIALDARELWSIIPVLTLRSHWTELALQRSLPVPITISIDLDDLHIADHWQKPQWYRQCISTVLPHLWRARTLSLSGLQDESYDTDDDDDDPEDVWYWRERLSDDIMDALTTTTPQFLQCLTICATEESGRELPDDIFFGQRTPKLCKLVLDNVYWQYPFSSPILHPSITYLEIRGGGSANIAEEQMPMLEVLRWLPGLQILVISRSTYIEPGRDSDPPVTLPHLRQIQISDELEDLVHFWRHLILPPSVEIYFAVPLTSSVYLAEQSARMVTELGQIYRDQVSKCLASGASYTTLDVTQCPIGPLDVAYLNDVNFILSHSDEPAADNVIATLPHRMAFTVCDWDIGFDKTLPTRALTSTIHIKAVLDVMPALDQILEVNVDSGKSGFDRAVEWLEVAGTLENVERINVKSGAARGLVIALRQTAEESSPIFPNLKVLTIERLVFFDGVSELSEFASLSNSFFPPNASRRLPSITVKPIFVMLLEALQARVASDRPLRLRVHRCSLTTDMVDSFRNCLGADSLEWDGKLDARR